MKTVKMIHIGRDFSVALAQPHFTQFLILFSAFNAALLAGKLHAEDDALPVRVDADNYETWREHILPEESEFAWQKVAWLTTFKDGIIAGDREQKPILLWTMNGHPLGCT